VSVVQQFGRVESAHIVKDRKTGNNRGLAYVRFSRAYHAAMALENCDQSETFLFTCLSTVESTQSL